MALATVNGSALVRAANDSHTYNPAFTTVLGEDAAVRLPAALHHEPQQYAAQFARMRFTEAAAVLLAATAPASRGRGAEINATYAAALKKFFGDMRLSAIHIGHIEAYQTARLSNAEGRWKRQAKASAINHEISFLQRVLKRASLWTSIGDLYKALPLVDSGRRKVMTDLEERRFHAVAASRPDWAFAYHVAVLTLSTTRAGVELRNLQMQDVILDGREPRIIVNGATAKNSHRGGAVPLATEAGLAAARALVDRAKSLGACKPDHYVFPWRKGRGAWDLTRPASCAWLRRSWESLKEAAGLPWLTPHCLRHQAITKLAEAKVSDEGIRQIAGHVSQEMLRVYSHCRLEHQAENLRVLEVRSGPRPRPAGAVQPAQARSLSPRLRRTLLLRRRTV